MKLDAERKEELECRLALLLSRKFKVSQIHEIVEHYGSATEFFNIPENEFAALRGVRREKVKLARDIYHSGKAREEREACEQSETQLIMFEDPEYPALLREIQDPPNVLWQRGAFEAIDELSFAIVGSRNASYYGTSQANRFATELAQRDITVVSGLARGVDSAAHRGALEAGGRTIAVVGSGFSKLYPPENARLAKEITQRGVLLSEFPLQTPAHPRNFPQRNRIISGLSLGVLVAQASLRSGSLITARLAGEQGREVFAIPGKIDTGDYEGSHRLLKEGAKLVTSIQDILSELPGSEELPTEVTEVAPKRKPAAETSTESALISLLTPSDSIDIEELIERSGLAAEQVKAALLMLEMKGKVKQLPGLRYVLGK